MKKILLLIVPIVILCGVIKGAESPSGDITVNNETNFNVDLKIESEAGFTFTKTSPGIKKIKGGGQFLNEAEVWAKPTFENRANWKDSAKIKIQKKDFISLINGQSYFSIQKDDADKKLVLLVVPGQPKKPEPKKEGEDFQLQVLRRFEKLEAAQQAANAKISTLEERIKTLESKK